MVDEPDGGRAAAVVSPQRRGADLAFYVGLGALFTHEIDAMPNHEWRVLPLLRALPDDLGMTLFVTVHVPLFAALVALVASLDLRTRLWSRLVIGGFLVVHGVLHALTVGDPGYEFSSLVSEALIFGGAALGAVYLAFEGWGRAAR